MLCVCLVESRLVWRGGSGHRGERVSIDDDSGDGDRTHSTPSVCAITDCQSRADSEDRVLVDRSLEVFGPPPSPSFVRL